MTSHKRTSGCGRESTRSLTTPTGYSTLTTTTDSSRCRTTISMSSTACICSISMTTSGTTSTAETGITLSASLNWYEVLGLLLWHHIRRCCQCQNQVFRAWMCSRACHLGGQYWDYHAGTLSCCKDSATYLKIRQPQMESRGPQSSNELHWVGFKDRTPG